MHQQPHQDRVEREEAVLEAVQQAMAVVPYEVVGVRHKGLDPR
jgi:hypothetical protein